ncbi:MAG: peptide chain release factor 2 [bacterium]
MPSGGIFDVDGLEKEREEINNLLRRPDMWENKEKIAELGKRLSIIDNNLSMISRLILETEEIETGLLLLEEEEDSVLMSEMLKKIEKVSDEIERENQKIIMTGKYDKGLAIMTIIPGAGGVESQDWASMLFRMYIRFLEREGFDFKVIYYQPEEEAGIREATIMIESEYSYGNLISESGVHRLIRLSPFDANHRRHTSFTGVSVIPYFDRDIDVEIDPDEIKIDTFRSSGPGGQHVNVTDSAVRITHLPTGIVVTCQNERSQYRNKEIAMNILKSRLFQLKIEEIDIKIDELRDKSTVKFGSQIRSYILHPYRLVKDHRTGLEITDTDDVLDGNIRPFISAYLKARMMGKL